MEENNWRSHARNYGDVMIMHHNKSSFEEDQCIQKTNLHPQILDSSDQVDQTTRLSPVETKLKKKQALLEFRCMVEDAILGNYILKKPNKNFPIKGTNNCRDTTLWGVPLLPSKGHQSTDNVLLKFLMARDYKVLDAFNMLRKTLIWRKQYKIDTILEEDLGLDYLEKFVYTNSVDKQGHPLYYNVYGVFQDKELYRKVLGSEESRSKFLRWRIQFMERCTKQLSFRDGEPNSIVQITDLKNSTGPDMKELRCVTEKAFILVQANYPNIIQRHILINVPFWAYTSRVLSSKLVTQRTKKRLVFARPAKVTQTLLKYISPEQLPTEYGGLKRVFDADFLPQDKASEIIIRPNTTVSIQIPANEGGVTIVWDITVVGWEVKYEEEFIPEDEGSYRVQLTRDKKNTCRVVNGVRNSFYISEAGNIFITIHNSTLKKKTVFYRSKSIPTLPSHFLLPY